MSIPASVTDVARHFSEYVSRVLFRGERFVLLRGKRPVAELRPVHVGVRVCDLPAVFANLPSLETDDAAAFAADIREMRERLDAVPPRDHWSE